MIPAPVPGGTLRAVLVTIALVIVSLVGIPVQWLALRFSNTAARGIPHLYHRIVCKLVGVRITTQGNPAHARPLLLVSNHVSWLDICVFSAVMPVSFVAKNEVAGWPVFGLFARLQRTVFVNRNSRMASRATAREMADRLKANDALMLFAEGTSSDGGRVLSFRSALLGAVEGAMAEADERPSDVQPVAIAYTRLHGLPLTRRDRARIAWFGDMDLLPHLWSILKSGGIDVTVAFGAAITPAPGHDRKELTRRLEGDVRMLFSNIVFAGKSERESVPVAPVTVKSSPAE